MTREEEIKKVAYSLTNKTKNIPDNNLIAFEKGIILGAEWADQHPRNGLWDSEKVASFIKYHAQEFVYISRHSGEAKINEFKLVEAMYKAMED